jgi:hypothetical protein
MDGMVWYGVGWLGLGMDGMVWGWVVRVGMVWYGMGLGVRVGMDGMIPH